MKKINGLLLASLLIFTPLLSIANETEQHETNTEQIEAESTWGRTLLHGASSLVSALGICFFLYCGHTAPNSSEASTFYLFSALFAVNSASSGVALYDLHKKDAIPVCGVRYDTPSSEIAPLNK